MPKLGLEFYTRENVLQISQDLLGKILYTSIDGVVTAGRIVETEAYMAPLDKASHAFNNKKTPRTKIFYEQGGIAYIYLCYGIHYLFNIITNKAEVPHAILIRALEPVKGIDIMLQRRKKTLLDYSLTSGPGALCSAMGINKTFNGMSLTEDLVWIEDTETSPFEIVTGPRVGISYAQEFVLKPWRFAIQNNPWVSKPKL